MKCLVFSSGTYNFGADIDEVREIGKKKNAVVIREDEGFFIIKYREKTFTIININEIFKIKNDVENILFTTLSDKIGFLIGRIKGIFEIVEKNVSKRILNVNYIKYIGEIDDETIFILDLQSIIKSREIYFKEKYELWNNINRE